MPVSLAQNSVSTQLYIVNAVSAPSPTATTSPADSWVPTTKKAAVLMGTLLATGAVIYFAYERGAAAGLDSIHAMGLTKAINDSIASCSKSNILDVRECADRVFRSTTVVDNTNFTSWFNYTTQAASFAWNHPRFVLAAVHVAPRLVPYTIALGGGVSGIAYSIRNQVTGVAKEFKETVWPQGQWTTRKAMKLAAVWSLMMAGIGYGMYRYGISVGTEHGIANWSKITSMGMPENLTNQIARGFEVMQNQIAPHAVPIVGGGSSLAFLGSELADPAASSRFEEGLRKAALESRELFNAIGRQTMPSLPSALASTAENIKEQSKFYWNVISTVADISAASTLFFNYVVPPVTFAVTTVAGIKYTLRG